MKLIRRLSNEYQNGYPKSLSTSLENLTNLTVVEMKKLAPFANPAQYPNGYRGMPGDLVRSIDYRGSGNAFEITAGVPYAIRRNFENRLNPNTKYYIGRSLSNVLNGVQSRWWRAL